MSTKTDLVYLRASSDTSPLRDFSVPISLYSGLRTEKRVPYLSSHPGFLPVVGSQFPVVGSTVVVCKRKVFERFQLRSLVLLGRHSFGASGGLSGVPLVVSLST